MTHLIWKMGIGFEFWQAQHAERRESREAEIRCLFPFSEFSRAFRKCFEQNIEAGICFR